MKNGNLQQKISGISILFTFFFNSVIQMMLRVSDALLNLFTDTMLLAKLCIFLLASIAFWIFEKKCFLQYAIYFIVIYCSPSFLLSWYHPPLHRSNNLFQQYKFLPMTSPPFLQAENLKFRMAAIRNLNILWLQ